MILYVHEHMHIHEHSFVCVCVCACALVRGWYESHVKGVMGLVMNLYIRPPLHFFQKQCKTLFFCGFEVINEEKKFCYTIFVSALVYVYVSTTCV